MGTRTRPAAARRRTAEPRILVLAQLEGLVSGRSVRTPSEANVMRETSRALQVMASGTGEFATIVVERSAAGLRIVEGRDALEVARMLRARAELRGDRRWARELALGLRFRIVEREPQVAKQSRGGLVRRMFAPPRTSRPALG